MAAGRVKVGLVQTAVSEDAALNLRTTIERVREAAGRGARIICLQELYRSRYFPQSQSAQVAHLAETIPGESTEAFSALAKELEVVVVVPLFEKTEGERYFNSAVVVDADGSLCPEEDLGGCSGHNDFRGWWSARFDAQFLLYDPADLARVAAGEMEPWEPQPYAFIDIDEHLFLNPAGIEGPMLGTGDQRRFRVGDLAYDRENGLLYLLELFADEAKPVVHVWQVR